MERISKKKLTILCCILFNIQFSFAKQYEFDSSLLSGSNTGNIDVEKFNNILEGQLSEGEYLVDVYLNNKKIKTAQKVNFATIVPNSDEIELCFDEDLMKITYVKLNASEKEKIQRQCQVLSNLIPSATWEFDPASLTLSLSIPSAALYYLPQDFIPESEWEHGTTALFTNYNTNYYQTRNTDRHDTYKYFWGNLNSGLNIGLWQLRNQSNVNYTKNDNSNSQYKWNNLQTYLQRPVFDFRGVLTLGETYTQSDFFNNFSFTGIKVETDRRMWPQSQQGYAPVVRGIAKTTAKVIVRQHGKNIFETVVAPGPFVISDIFHVASKGDLDIEILEANGEVSTFTVPYSSVAQSMRPGHWNYQFAFGFAKNFKHIRSEFVEYVYQYGINNYLTANANVRFAENYQAYLLGGVFATQLGAFGVNTAYTRSKIEDYKPYKTGWRLEGNYSKYLNSGTNVTLTAAHNGSKNYFELYDIFQIRRSLLNKDYQYTSNSIYQKNRYSASIGQNMGRFGSFSFNWSLIDYYDNLPDNKQFQINYNNSWKNIGYTLSFTRQRTIDYHYNLNGFINDADIKHENLFSIGLSIPIYWKENYSSLSVNFNKKGKQESVSTTLNGTIGKQRNPVAYSIFSNYDHNSESKNTLDWGVSLQKDTPLANLNASFSSGEDYKQFNVGASGSLVLHKGGLTVGPRLGETFAIIKAKGAKGAALESNQDIEVNRFGYALLPSLVSYRYNNVTLDSKNMNTNVELQGGSKQIVPYAGVIPFIEFKTIIGYPALIKTLLNNTEMLPMGADVYDEQDNLIGMVGQASQIYARIGKKSGYLIVKWANDSNVCKIDYQLPTIKDENIINITAPCKEVQL